MEGSGRGGVPVQQERSGVRWIAKSVSDVCVRQRSWSWSDSSVTPVLLSSFYGLVVRLLWTSFRDLRCEKTVSTR